MQHAMPSQLHSGSVVNVWLVLSELWTRSADSHSPCCDTSCLWRRRLPSTVGNPSMQHAVPSQLHSESVERIWLVLSQLRLWLAEPHTLCGNACLVRRSSLPSIDGDTGVRRAMPC